MSNRKTKSGSSGSKSDFQQGSRSESGHENKSQDCDKGGRLSEKWQDTRSSKQLSDDGSKYDQAEQGAQSRLQGLWGDKATIEPMIWRKSDHE